MKNIYTLDASFTFTGTLKIQAESLEDALRIAKEDFSVTLGEGASTSNDEQVINWDIGLHPDSKKFDELEDQDLTGSMKP
jgi:hypothetical protein